MPGVGVEDATKPAEALKEVVDEDFRDLNERVFEVEKGLEGLKQRGPAPNREGVGYFAPNDTAFMSLNNNGRSRSKDTPEERRAKFLEKHEDRMRKVDETIDAVKSRNGRSGRVMSNKRGR